MKVQLRILRLSALLGLLVLSACSTPVTEIAPTDAPTAEETDAQQPTSEPAPDDQPTPTEEAQVSDEPIELNFTLWINGEAQLAVLKEIADSYTAEHPNVTVNYVFTPFADYVSNLTIQLAGNNPPDAGWLVENSAHAFTEAGVVADLGPALRSDSDYNYADFGEEAMGLWTEGDAVHGIPFSTSPFVMIYNRSLFEQAGVDTPDVLLANGEWTWEKVREVSKTIKDSTGVYGYQSLDAGLYTDRSWHNLIPIIRAYGGDAWDDNNQCELASDESVEAVQLVHDMIFEDESMVPPGEEVDFYSGGAAMTMGQISRVARLADASFEWDIVPLPSGPAGYSPVIGQAAIVVFNESEHRDVAIDFVRHMTTAENVTKLAQFFPPARVSVLESEALLAANPTINPESMQAAVIEAIPQGSVLSSHRQFTNIDLTARPIFDTIWTPDGDVTGGLIAVCDAIQPFLDQ